MKITHIRIGHFGKLHNVEIDFTDRVNVVFGPNESGKSTIHAFIGAMLFGLDRSRGRAGKDDLYTRYKPWDTPGSYQGSLDFEHEGVNYRITRVFYQKEKACTCTNLDTGRNVALPDDSITSLIPKLTKSAYYNTISMGQSALRCTSDFGGEVHNYIANLATSKESRIDVSDATKRLTKRCRDIQKSVKDIDREIEETEEDISDLKLNEERIAKLEEDRKAAAAQLLELDGQYESMTKELPDASEATAKWKELKAKAEEAQNAFYLEEMSANDRVVSYVRHTTEYEQKVSDVEEHISKASKGVSELRLLGLILIAVGAVACVISNGRYKAGLIGGIVVAAAGIIALVAYLIKTREIKALEAAKKKAEEELKDAQEKVQKAENEDDARLALMRQKSDEAAMELQKAAEVMAAISEEREKIVSAERELRGRIAEAKAALTRAEGGIEAIGDIGDALFEEETKLNTLTEQRNSLNADYKAYALALDTIENLSQNIHDSFSSEFNDILSEEICLATDGTYTMGRISDTLNIEVMSGIDYISAEQLSNGACEQLYLALRFAVARLFFSDIEVPILLDESFAYSDDERLKSVMSAVAERENGQIIIFSCIGREAEVLKSLGAAFNEIKLG